METMVARVTVDKRQKLPVNTAVTLGNLTTLEGVEPTFLSWRLVFMIEHEAVIIISFCRYFITRLGCTELFSFPK